MRFKFEEIFGKRTDETFVTKRFCHVNGVTICPGFEFPRGIAFGGIDVTLFEEMDIEADSKVGVLDIKGFYSCTG